MKRKPTKIKRALRADEYIVYRNRKGRVAKFRKDVLLVAEVRSRKTNKRVGFLNSIDKKTKKPVARRFTSMQRALLSRKQTESVPVRSESQMLGELKFRVYTSKLIKDQIPGEVVRRVNEEIKINGEIVIAIETSHPAVGVARSAGLFVDHRVSRQFIANHIALTVVDLAHNSLQIRTSAKKYGGRDRHKQRKLPRYLDVEVVFLALGF